MLGIVTTGEDALRWNLEALEIAKVSESQRERNWKGSLYNNIGWTYHAMGDFEEALDVFRRGLEVREAQGDPESIRIARWTVARTLRSLGRIDEALAAQRAIQHDFADADDPYVEEELGECLLELGKPEEAKAHFARAHEKLSKDPWLQEHEPDRLERLRGLAGSADEDLPREKADRD